MLCLVVLFYCGDIWAGPRDKVMLTTHNLCPYGCYREGSSQSDRSHFSGFAVDVVKCVFSQIDIELEIDVVPWARAQRMVKYGEADGFFAASQKSTRDEFAVMSAVIAEQNWQWYLLSDNPLNPTDLDFKQKAIVGGFIGSNMLKWMDDSGYKVSARPINSEILLKMLLAKRIDAVLANNYVMDELLLTYGVKENIKTVVSKNKPLGVYFSKQFLLTRPHFLAQFNSHVPSCVKAIKSI